MTALKVATVGVASLVCFLIGLLVTSYRDKADLQAEVARLTAELAAVRERCDGKAAPSAKLDRRLDELEKRGAELHQRIVELEVADAYLFGTVHRHTREIRRIEAGCSCVP